MTHSKPLEYCIRAWLRNCGQRPHVIEKVMTLAKEDGALESYHWDIKATVTASLNVQARVQQILHKVRKMKRWQCRDCTWLGWEDELQSDYWDDGEGGEYYSNTICPGCGTIDDIDYDVHSCDYTGRK